MPEEQQSVEETSLADFKKARNEGVAISEPEPVEKEKPEEQEQTEEKTEEKPKQKGWNGAQKKIDRLTKHNAELEKRAETAEREREELRAKNGKTEEKPAPKADDEPKEEDFNGDVKAFFKAQARWEARQEFKAQAEAEEKAQEDAKTKEIFDNHNVKVSEARAKYEDFDESVTSTDTPWKDGSKSDVNASIAFQIAVFESGNGGEILYYLSKHRDELEKMRGLSPARVQMAIGKIADKLEAQKEELEDEEIEQEQEEEKPEKKKLPTPITPVGKGSARTSKSLADRDLPLSEFKKARQAGKIS
jgi:hypothetical protein